MLESGDNGRIFTEDDIKFGRIELTFAKYRVLHPDMSISISAE
jgi:hypothetical protein